MIAHGLVAWTLSLSSLAAPPVGPAFAEVWYREVIEGNVAVAAKEYETLYLSQPSYKVPRTIQQKAAFRAGRCFEQLGLMQSAAPAYLAAYIDPFRTDFRLTDPDPGTGAQGKPGDASTRVISAEAMLRLRELGGGATLIQGLEDASLALAVQAAVEVLRGTEKTRSGTLAALETALSERRLSLRARREVLERLESRGARLSFPPSARPELTAQPLSELRELLSAEPELHRLVLQAVRDRLLQRALGALQARDVGRALREHRLWRLLGGEVPPGAGSNDRGAHASLLAELEDSVEAPGSNISGAAAFDRLARMASRRLLDLELERKSGLLRDLFSLLSEASMAELNHRRHEAWALLDKVRQTLDWTSRELREDAEVRAVAALALLRQRVFARNAELDAAVVRLGSLLRGHADRLLELVSLWLEEALEEARLRSPALVHGGPDAESVCRGEIETLLFVASGGVTPAGEGRSTLDARGALALSQAAWIAEWVPGALSPSSRALLDSLSAATSPRVDPLGSRKTDVRGSR